MKIELRTEKLNELRKENIVPGVMYGRSIDSTSVQAEKNEVLEAIKTYGKNKTFKVRVDGKYHHVYIKNVQSNILNPHDIIHFDLHRVTPKETISTEIPVELKGKEAFYNKTLYASLELSEITAEYIPGSGVSSFDIDVSKLEINDEIKVKDLKVPKGITIKNDPNQTVVLMKEVNIAVEEEEKTLTEELEDALEAQQIDNITTDTNQ
ncbi:MAG: 50S ribosomal protein L25 [Firmicutes bacterium]|nr:50S ribosomal protein L25 [Bacillota bacterium]